MPATPQDRLYGLTTSVAVKPPVYISADYDIIRFGEQTITSKTPTDERTITTTEGMRVLLLGQDNPVENGIWVARRSFWVRATDFNGPRDAVNGTLVFSINGDCWQVEADDPVVIGKSAIHFRPTYPFEANLDIFQRTLRVPEASVNVLPSAEDRAWKGLGFDGAGQPKLQDPAGTGLWGYVPAIGSFEKGSLLTQRFEVLLWESTDEYWRWDGAMPKIVLPGSTPDTAGGRGKGKWLDVTDATLRSNLGSDDGLKWVGGLGYTNPQKHGAISNNSLVDNTAAVMNAITESVLTGVGLDLRGGPWRVNQTVDLTLVKNIITDYSGRFLINPATFIAKHDRKFVVTFGNPDTDFRSDRATHTTMLGNMVVISDDRSAELSGIYIKGALGCFGAFRVVNFNGGGFRADAWWDSVCLSISAELCGNLTQFAIDINPSGDTSNCLNIGRLQCERAFHKQINANIIRSTLGPIHAERLKILTLDDGTTGLKSGLTYLNTSIVLSNCTVAQLILDAATDAEAGTVSTTPSVRLNLYESKAQSLHLATRVVTSTYGERGSIDNSAFYKYYNPGYSVSLNACRMTRTTGDGLLQAGGAGVVASNCTIDAFQPESGTTRILLSACTINNDYSNPKDNVSGVIFNSCTLNGDIGQTGPTEAAEPTLFHQCKVKGTVRGYFQNKFIMEGGYAEAVELVSRSYACLINVRGGTFSHAETGDLGYITRGCAFSSVTRWGPPRFGNYKAGERTHRMGEMGSGSVIEYVNTAAGAATFVAAITLP